MSNYFEKARELGELIKESEYAKIMADARAVYEENEAAVQMLNEYASYQNNVKQSMDQGVMTTEQARESTQRLAAMVHELKQEPAIAALIFAENEFNAFVNQVMNVLKFTITGEDESDGCSTGECGSCAGCH